MHPNTKRLIEEAESEFGESFESIVRGFAADSYSRAATAKVLGFGVWAFSTAIAGIEGIEWPAIGCSVFNKDLPPQTEEHRKKHSIAKRSMKIGRAGEYEKATGEPADAAIIRLAKDYHFAEVARRIGWRQPNEMRAWMQVRGIKAKFKRIENKPPQGKGLQSRELRAVL